MEILPPHLAKLVVTPSEINRLRSHGFYIAADIRKASAKEFKDKAFLRGHLERIEGKIHPQPPKPCRIPQFLELP
jgi:hypothetical protein